MTFLGVNSRFGVNRRYRLCETVDFVQVSYVVLGPTQISAHESSSRRRVFSKMDHLPGGMLVIGSRASELALFFIQKTKAYWLRIRLCGNSHRKEWLFNRKSQNLTRVSKQLRKADGEGFEPPVRFPVRRFSKPVP